MCVSILGCWKFLGGAALVKSLQDTWKKSYTLTVRVYRKQLQQTWCLATAVAYTLWQWEPPLPQSIRIGTQTPRTRRHDKGPLLVDDGGTPIPPPSFSLPTPAHNPKSKDQPPLPQHSQTSQPTNKLRSSCTKTILHSTHLRLSLLPRRSEPLPLWSPSFAQGGPLAFDGFLPLGNICIRASGVGCGVRRGWGCGCRCRFDTGLGGRSDEWLERRYRALRRSMLCLQRRRQLERLFSL